VSGLVKGEKAETASTRGSESSLRYNLPKIMQWKSHRDKGTNIFIRMKDDK